MSERHHRFQSPTSYDLARLSTVLMQVKRAVGGSVPVVERQLIREIDALRGLAALGVSAVFHIGYAVGTYRTGPLDGLPFFTWLHDEGWTLVDLFFVISGFIFAHVYLDAAGKLREGVTARDFFVARFARLYPLHLGVVIL